MRRKGKFAEAQFTEVQYTAEVQELCLGSADWFAVSAQHDDKRRHRALALPSNTASKQPPFSHSSARFAAANAAHNFVHFGAQPHHKSQVGRRFPASLALAPAQWKTAVTERGRGDRRE